MADRWQTTFLRTLRALRNLRRYAPNVVIQERGAGQRREPAGERLLRFSMFLLLIGIFDATLIEPNMLNILLGLVTFAPAKASDLGLERSRFGDLRDRGTPWDFHVAPFDDTPTLLLFPAGSSKVRYYLSLAKKGGTLASMSMGHDGTMHKGWFLRLVPAKPTRATGTLLNFLNRSGLKPATPLNREQKTRLGLKSMYAWYSFEVITPSIFYGTIDLQGHQKNEKAILGRLATGDYPRTDNPYPVSQAEISFLASRK